MKLSLKQTVTQTVKQTLSQRLALMCSYCKCEMSNDFSHRLSLDFYLQTDTIDLTICPCCGRPYTGIINDNWINKVAKFFMQRVDTSDQELWLLTKQLIINKMYYY